MQAVISTAQVGPRHQLDFWHAAVRDNLATVRFQCEARHGFDGLLQRQSFSALDILQITTATAHKVMRCREALGAASDDYYFVSIGLVGMGLSCQDGRQALLKRGVLVLEDGTRPYQFEADASKHSHLVLRVPRALLRQRIGHVDRLILGRGISHNSELVGLFATFVVHLLKLRKQLEPLVMDQLANQTLDLLAMVLMQSTHACGAGLSVGHTDTLYRVKTFVRMHLQDPELSPAKIAGALGISSRYINKLFEDENTSLMRYVWDCRLEQCRRDLGDPARAAAGVSQVAFRWGFNELSHFSRAFKARFGISPRQFQRLKTHPEHLPPFRSSPGAGLSNPGRT